MEENPNQETPSKMEAAVEDIPDVFKVLAADGKLKRVELYNLDNELHEALVKALANFLAKFNLIGFENEKDNDDEAYAIAGDILCTKGLDNDCQKAILKDVHHYLKECSDHNLSDLEWRLDYVAKKAESKVRKKNDKLLERIKKTLAQTDE